MMKIFLTDVVVGAFAIDSNGNVISRVVAPNDINRLVERALKLEEGLPTDEFLKLVDELVGNYGRGLEVVVDIEGYVKYLSDAGFKTVLEYDNEVLLKFKDELPRYAVELGFIKSVDEYYDFLHTLSLAVTRSKLRKVAQKRDLLAVQAIRAIDDIDKVFNLFASRLREWYSIHFPELDDIIKEHIDYARIVAELGSRDYIDEKGLKKLGFSEGKIKRIISVSERSMGAELSNHDIEPIQTLANIMIELDRLRDELTSYLSSVMKEVAPNTTELVGPLLGARLLSLSGSLETLAKLPASTIQVLGAEKALFRALRTGGKPPKHGVIFQYPEIHKAPRWQRGKIARSLATKLAIAVKADYFTGRFIADKLKRELEERINEIKTTYAKPPVKPTKAERVRGPKPKKK
ncbi:MAG: C/D box methylation guide ribonucleoprotein complex aNOP56 subunit [Sulfolobales archaeon]